MGHGLGQPQLRAAVLFYDKSDHWSRAFLASGFRHCDVVVETEVASVWLGIVGKIGGIITGVAITDFDPVAFAEKIGARCVVLPRHRPRARRWPFMVSNCVGIAKAVLGVREPWIVTPRQLYRRLTRDGCPEGYVQLAEAAEGRPDPGAGRG